MYKQELQKNLKGGILKSNREKVDQTSQGDSLAPYTKNA